MTKPKMAFLIKCVSLILLALVSFSLADDECGDGYSCAFCGSGYGCAKDNVGVGECNCVCCSAGQSAADCKISGNASAGTLPFCPAGGATKQGCIRLVGGLRPVRSQRKSHKSEQNSLVDERVTFDEECGDGYTCTYQDAYGCAKLPVTKNSTMVCCSAGQGGTACADASKHAGRNIPICPAGGATGEGCVREAEEGHRGKKDKHSLKRKATVHIN